MIGCFYKPLTILAYILYSFGTSIINLLSFPEPSLLSGTASGFSGNDPLIRQNPANANSMAAKMYEERLKLPPQRDSLDEASIKVPPLARSGRSYLLVYSYYIVS